MKNKTKTIICFILVIVTISLFSVTSFAQGYWNEGEDEETGEPYYPASSQRTNIIPITSMILSSRKFGGQLDFRKISFQNTPSYQGFKYVQSLNQENSRFTDGYYDDTYYYTAENSGLYSIRDMSKLVGKGVYKNSQLYYDIGLDKYDTAFEDVIRYALPSTGIKTIRSDRNLYKLSSDSIEGNWIPGDYTDEITSIRFNFYGYITTDKGEYRPFTIHIKTKYHPTEILFIDTRPASEHYDTKYRYWVFDYEADQTFKQFLKQIYPMPTELPANFANDYATVNTVKNHIFFNLILNETSGLNSLDSTAQSRAYSRNYIFETVSQKEMYELNGESYTEAVLNFYTNDDFIRNRLYKIEYEIAPFVIMTKGDFYALCTFATELKKISGMELTTTIEADISIFDKWAFEVQENNGGQITNYYNAMGMYIDTKHYTETREDGKLFFSSPEALHITGDIVINSIGVEELFEYDYNSDNSNRMPLLISNMRITQMVSMEDVSNEHDLYGILQYKINYYLPNTYANQEIYKYISTNPNFEGNAMESAVIFGRNEFNVPPPEPWNLGDFFDGILTFMNEPIIGPFSIANILYVVIAIGVLFAVLKYFAGG